LQSVNTVLLSSYLHIGSGDPDDPEREDKNEKNTANEKTKPKEKNLSRYGSFYLRLGAIGNISNVYLIFLHYFILHTLMSKIEELDGPAVSALSM
jgi:hypothetical protein